MRSGGQLLGFACWSEGASHENASGMGWSNMVEPPKDVFEGADQVEVKHYDGCVFSSDEEEVNKY